MLRKSVVFLALLFCSVAPSVYALGLGNVTVESALNQPLRVRIEILQLGDTRLQDVSVQMASVADFQRFNIDRVSFLSEIRFNVASSPNGNFVTLTSNQIVREPYLSFILDTRWPSGRLLSEHTILLDLPVFNDQQQAQTRIQAPISPVRPIPRAASQPAVTPAQAVTPTATEPEPTVEATPEPAAETEAVSVEELAAEPAAEPDPVATEPEPAPVAVEPEPTPIVATPEPAAPESIATSANETLTEIALRVRPNNAVTMQQTMLAIQRLNPNAFIGGNINRMRAGEVLRVPGLSEIESVDAREAADEVSRQNRDFAAADFQPLAAPANTTPAQDRAPQGQLSVVTADDDGIDANNAGNTPTVAENAALDERIAALETQLARQQEEADRARIQREEMQARMSELESQIAAAQEIIRLQDLQLAQLQDSLAEAAAQQAAIALAEAELAAAARANRPSLMDTVMGVLTSTAFFIGVGVVALILLLVVLLLRRNRARDDESDIDELDERAFDTDDAGDDASYLKYEDDDFDKELDGFLGRDNAGGNTLGQAGALMRQGKTSQAIKLLLVAVDDEPDNQELRLKLLEALAVEGDADGFEDQAEQLNGDAATTARVDALRQKLQQSASKTKFSKQSQDEDDELGAASFLDDLGIDLDAFDDDDEEETILQTAPAVQEESDPGPELEEEAELEPEADFDFDAPEPVAKSSKDDDGMDLSFDLSDDKGKSAENTLEFDDDESFLPQSVKPEAEDDDSNALEFVVSELSTETAVDSSKDRNALDIESLEFSIDDTPKAAPEPEAELDIETFEFDADDLMDDMATDSEGAEPLSTAATDRDDEDDNSLDFDFNKTEIKVPEKAKDLAEDLETFDFDLDTDSASTVVEKPTDKVRLDLDTDDFDAGLEEKTVIDSKDDVMFDFDLDDDGDATDSGAKAPTPTIDDLDDDDLDDLDFLSDGDDIEIESVDDVEEVSMLSNDDEVATKLELAYAYRKMGDNDGAREILEEVVKEGSQAQIKEANDLMASLGNKD